MNPFLLTFSSQAGWLLSIRLAPFRERDRIYQLDKG
jgi:hypothetical protein